MENEAPIDAPKIVLALFGALLRQPSINAEALGEDFFSSLARHSPALAEEIQALLTDHPH